MATMEHAALPRGNAGSIVIPCAEATNRVATAFRSALPPVRTTVADDGYHANRALRSDECRLFVTDRVPPPWPGPDTFRRLRARNPDLRTAFLEGARRGDVGLAKMTGATDVLGQSLCRRGVAEAIDAAMRKS
jgi:hypothetical protein